jgi:hypothetical protein
VATSSVAERGVLLWLLVWINTVRAVAASRRRCSARQGLDNISSNTMAQKEFWQPSRAVSKNWLGSSQNSQPAVSECDRSCIDPTGWARRQTQVSFWLNLPTCERQPLAPHRSPRQNLWPWWALTLHPPSTNRFPQCSRIRCQITFKASGRRQLTRLLLSISAKFHSITSSACWLSLAERAPMHAPICRRP